MNPANVLKYPVSTEKAIRLMESQNKIVFVVDRKSNKNDVQRAFELMFKVKVTDVKTVITPEGKKRAYIKLSAESPALDIATQLGMM
ncbi:MAG TPA: 50S ribosomal protein L23 [Candidatus Nanoarchaeia archaeon]|nr:50S ribosomal protein L23 [Candidatus Nanoarchaeia archaeon]